MTSEEKIIKNKVGLVKLAQTLGNVSQACKVMGYSRDSFGKYIQKTSYLHSDHEMKMVHHPKLRRRKRSRRP